jgi:beta-1,4-mannosyltransferase
MKNSYRELLGVLRRRVRILVQAPRLGVHVWIQDNPYSEVLYRQFRHAWAPQRMTLLEELDAFTRLPANSRLLWIHSEASYSWGRSGNELAKAHRSYLGSLERWSAKKGRLIWTVHDESLHLNDPNTERVRAIRDKLREMADCVHVHSEAAKAVVVQNFQVDPNRIIVIRHPSYAPLYKQASGGGTEDANAHNRFPRHLLCFGHVKGYKNYGALAEALNELGAGSFERLTIAGQPSGDVSLPEESYRQNLELDLRLRFIPDAEVPQLFGSAHFLVLPYTESLTSGVAALSMGFGVPVIAPALGGMREAVPPENWPLIYDREESHGLARALHLARDMSANEYRALAESCRAFGEEIHPDRISSELIRALSQRGINVSE